MPDGVTVKIKKDSWHKRHYQFWLNELEGEAAAYKENFCRYMRIVLITVPRWKFFHGRIMRVVPPWTIPAALLLLAGILESSNAEPHYSRWAGAIIGIVVFVLAVIAGLIVAEITYPKPTRFILKWMTSPIWLIPYYLIYKPIKWFRRRFKSQIRLVGEVLYLLFMWAVGLGVAGLLVSGLVFRTHQTLRVLAIFGAAILIGGLWVALMAGAERIDKKFKRRQKKPIKRFFGGVKETVKLGATYISTKKEGTLICPFIDFEDEPAN
jgi:hypothetical protein